MLIAEFANKCLPPSIQTSACMWSCPGIQLTIHTMPYAPANPDIMLLSRFVDPLQLTANPAPT